MPHAFLTVATRNRLADVRALASSLAQHSQWPLYAVIIDEPDGVETPEPFELIRLRDLEIPDLQAMRMFYTAFELCNAVRPFAHDYMLRRTDVESWFYLDSDFLVVGAADGLFGWFEDHAVLLVPHLLQPLPSSMAAPSETDLLQFGVFNSGMLGVRRCDAAAAFVRWFGERLSRFSFVGYRSMFGDQPWLDFVPVFFSHVAHLTHPGVNVGYWNLYERLIARQGPGYTSNGHPLICVHFSQWSYDAPQRLHYGRPVHPDQSADVLAELGLQYREALHVHGYEDCRREPYGFERWPDGRRVSVAQRRHYYEMWLAGEAALGVPPTTGQVLASNCRRAGRRASDMVARVRRFVARRMNVLG